MSVKLSAYVWDGCALSGMKLTEVVIMARLADWCNDEGVCWPSVATIARQIGAGDSASSGTAATGTLTYCQAVLWIDPLLTAIDQANSQLAGIRDIEQTRQGK